MFNPAWVSVYPVRHAPPAPEAPEPLWHWVLAALPIVAIALSLGGYIP